MPYVSGNPKLWHISIGTFQTIISEFILEHWNRMECNWCRHKSKVNNIILCLRSKQEREGGRKKATILWALETPKKATYLKMYMCEYVNVDGTWSIVKWSHFNLTNNVSRPNRKTKENIECSLQTIQSAHASHTLATHTLNSIYIILLEDFSIVFLVVSFVRNSNPEELFGSFKWFLWCRCFIVEAFILKLDSCGSMYIKWIV